MINYYTDYHDVDEDLTSVSMSGRCWDSENVAGIAHRGMSRDPSDLSYNVAYKDKNTTLSSRMVFLMI